MIRGGNTSLMSSPDGPPKHKRRDLVMYVVLIDHPSEGLIVSLSYHASPLRRSRYLVKF